MALMSCLVDMGSVIFSRVNNLLGQTYIYCSPRGLP